MCAKVTVGLALHRLFIARSMVWNYVFIKETSMQPTPLEMGTFISILPVTYLVLVCQAKVHHCKNDQRQTDG